MLPGALLWDYEKLLNVGRVKGSWLILYFFFFLSHVAWLCTVLGWVIHFAASSQKTRSPFSPSNQIQMPPHRDCQNSNSLFRPFS